MTRDILCKNDVCQPSWFLTNLLTCFHQWLTMTVLLFVLFTTTGYDPKTLPEIVLKIFWPWNFFLFSLTLWPLSLSGRSYLFVREGCKEEKNIYNKFGLLPNPIRRLFGLFGSTNLWEQKCEGKSVKQVDRLVAARSGIVKKTFCSQSEDFIFFDQPIRRPVFFFSCGCIVSEGKSVTQWSTGFSMVQRAPTACIVYIT